MNENNISKKDLMHTLFNELHREITAKPLFPERVAALTKAIEVLDKTSLA
jgi:hypothetical protein